MIKKIRKIVMNEKVFSATNHLLVGGLSGYGKGMFIEKYITTKVGEYKVIDLYSEQRGEGMFYGFPQTNSNLIKKINLLSSYGLKPETYENEILMVRGSKLKKIKKLPANIRVVAFKEDLLTKEDIKNFVAFNESQRGLMDLIFSIDESNKYMTLSEIKMALSEATQDRKSDAYKHLKGLPRISMATVKRRVVSLLSSGIFCDDTQDFSEYFEVVDIKKVVSNKDVITSFNTLLLEGREEKGLALGMITKKLLERGENELFSYEKKERTPILIYVRDASSFWREDAPYLQLFKDNIEDILRLGRDLLWTVILDTQLPISDLPLKIYTQFDRCFCLRVPFNEAKKLTRFADVNEVYLRKLSVCEKGIGMYLSSGLFKYPVRVVPTLHRKKEEGADVFRYLASKFSLRDFTGSSYLVLEDNPPLKKDFVLESKMVDGLAGEENTITTSSSPLERIQRVREKG